MQVTDIVSLITNVGFPVTLCFILIKYVLQNVDEKLDKMDDALQTLQEELHSLEIEGSRNSGKEVSSSARR